MSTATQKVPLLHALTPAAESSRGDILQYNHLAPTVATYAPTDASRWREFLAAEPGSLEEISAARQLANLYMLMGLQALHQTTTPESATLWSERYTDASTQIYSVPSGEVARHLEVDGFEPSKELYETAEQVRDYLYGEYADVFACADEAVLPEFLTPRAVQQVFRDVLQTLSDYHDSDWREWSVVVDSAKDSLSVSGKSKQIIIGGKRRNMPITELHGLIAHEILVHAQCSLNGHKVSHLLGTGLPGYLEAEEGFGIFEEFALTGKIPQKMIDRYTDIAYALGELDGEPHTRQETLERVIVREQQRSPEKSLQDIEDGAYPHVNRIYRGSLGNEHIGIFTKDIAYYNGFMETIAFFAQARQRAIPIGETMQFRMSGCFNPSDQTHCDYIKTHHRKARGIR